jgi:hypothetical protein
MTVDPLSSYEAPSLSRAEAAPSQNKLATSIVWTATAAIAAGLA